MKRHKRLLALVVNARDLLTREHSSTRDAVVAAITSGALDLLQLRTDARDSESGNAAAAAEQLAALVARNTATTTAVASAACQQPALIFNAPLDVLANREDLLLRGFDGWHVKERDLVHADLPRLIKHARVYRLRGDDTDTVDNKDDNDTATSPIRLGCSVHSVASALLAARLGFDYIQVGTMFATASHPEKTALEGPALLRAIAVAAHDSGVLLPPLIAVGGINTPQQTREVLRAGADGVAVIRGILQAANGAHAAAMSYRAALDE